MFKKGDIVRCIDIHNDWTAFKLILNEIYFVEEDALNSLTSIKICNYFGIFNGEDGFDSYYSWRFKKVSSEDLTEEEKFNYIKYKLGIKEKTNGKKEKRTKRT